MQITGAHSSDWKSRSRSISLRYFASWETTPSVCRWPARRRLTPCRMFTRWWPRAPRTGRFCTAKTTASPWLSGTTLGA